MGTTTNLALSLQATNSNAGTWGANLNTNVLTLVDNALGSTYSPSVAGNSNVTLTTGQAGNLIHNLSGVLTGNISYIFPATAGRLLVIKNGTTGAFTVTVGPSGGTGLVIPQGMTQLVYIDSSTTTTYMPVNQTFTTAQSITSATTTDLGTKTSNIVTVSGTTTITSFGSSASAGNPLYALTFSGALVLTNNATSLILPGNANITTAANDTALALYLGSGNWQIIAYQRVSGKLPPSGLSNFMGSTTYNLATASGTTVISGLGITPAHVRFMCAVNGTGNACWGQDDGVTPGCFLINAGTFSTDSSNSIDIVTSGGNEVTGKITAFASGQFTITWVKSGSPTGTLTIYYEAY